MYVFYNIMKEFNSNDTNTNGTQINGSLKRGSQYFFEKLVLPLKSALHMAQKKVKRKIN